MSELLKKGDFVFIAERGPISALGVGLLLEVLALDELFLKVQTTPYYRDTQYNPPRMRKHNKQVFADYYLKTYLVPLLNIARIEHYSLGAAVREVGQKQAPGQTEAPHSPGIDNGPNPGEDKA